jgi:hypothetical protein
MLRSLTLSVLAVAVFTPVSAQQDATKILSTVQARQAEPGRPSGGTPSTTTPWSSP